MDGQTAYNYENEALDYALALRAAPRVVVGGVGVYWHPREHRVMELGYVLANGYRGDNNVRMFSALRVSDGRRDSFPDYVQLTGTILECALALEKAVTQ